MNKHTDYLTVLFEFDNTLINSSIKIIFSKNNCDNYNNSETSKSPPIINDTD